MMSDSKSTRYTVRWRYEGQPHEFLSVVQFLRPDGQPLTRKEIEREIMFRHKSNGQRVLIQSVVNR